MDGGLYAARRAGGRRRASLTAAALGLLLAASSTTAIANPVRAAALDAFARNCFSPFLTAETARAALAPHGRHDFYDLSPFSANAPSPANAEVRAGTDRRCELAFDGDHGTDAAEVAVAALRAEGIRSEAPMPLSARPGETTTLRGARFLNPARIAVVETGTRPGPNGTETFLRVERLTPEASAEAAQ